MVLKEIYILQKYHQQLNHKYDWHVFTMIQSKQSNLLSHKPVSFQWTQPKKNMTKNIYYYSQDDSISKNTGVPPWVIIHKFFMDEARQLTVHT